MKSKNDIYDIISEYVDLKHQGRIFKGLCPFHTEKTPSFCVYPDSKSFYCFGCGLGGDVITFIRLAERFEYMEAIEFLSKRSGLTIPDSTENNDIYKVKMVIYEINRAVARFYHKMLLDNANKKALEYLFERGLTLKTIRHFGLGYAPNSRYTLSDYLKNKGYDQNFIIQANLAVKTNNGNILDRFWNRIMFPIIDLRGNVIAFGGRVLSDGFPKYLNTSDTIVFKKSDNLFALNFAKNSTEKNIILAEGYMDVISLHQIGFTNAVASLGTSVTSEQIKLIARYTKEVIISYDSDTAGVKATNRALKMFQDNGISVKVLNISNGKDPDEFIKSYGDDAKIRFKTLVNSSKNYIDYKISNLKKNFDLNSSEQKVRYISEIAKLLSDLDNKIQQEIYANKLSQEMDIEKSTIMYEIKKYNRKKSKNQTKSELKYIKQNLNFNNLNFKDTDKSSLRARNAEESLISYIINNQDMANNIFLRVSDEKFSNEFNRKLYKVIKALVSQNKSLLNVTNIISQADFTFKEIGKITNLCSSYVPSEKNIDLVNEYISVLDQEYQRQKFKDVTNLDENAIKDYINGLRKSKN